MSNEPHRDLLPAIEMAAFERRRDGSFSPIAPLPSWFDRLVADPTFPFLGHILDEANQFWIAGKPACREWGPCAEVDDTGREFHYRVSAVNAKASQYLVFQLDAGTEEMRQVLQRVRQQMLATEQSRSTETTRLELRRAAEDICATVTTLLGASSNESRQETAQTLSTKCNELLRTIDNLAATQSP